MFMLTPSYRIPALPPSGVDLEDASILKALAKAHRHLAELKGCAKSIPNQGILIDTLALQEAKASSEVESYVTTQDELFQADMQVAEWVSPAAKEVARYREALKCGFDRMRAQQGLLTTNLIIELFQLLKNSNAGIRTTPGTVLKNERTRETVFVPPQDPVQLARHLRELETFINDDARHADLDPLIRMALIHHQFESIHPFSDGNGRIGRILCVLYLARTGLLDIPVLYLSRYINAYKQDYYGKLQAVRDHAGTPQHERHWQAWVVFMLEAVAQTSMSTVRLVDGMRGLMSQTKQRLRKDVPAIYSQDLLNNIFRHPYTRIEFLQNDLGITRQTASRYLKKLAHAGVLREYGHGKRLYFINDPLVDLLMRSETEQP
jgi:Fic family protein